MRRLVLTNANLLILPEAEAAGVRLLLGDDYGAMGFPHGSYGGELRSYVEDARIAPLAVLRWATVNGAHLLGRGDELGTIEAGKLADILIVDGDPSRDIAVLADREPIAVPGASERSGTFHRYSRRLASVGAGRGSADLLACHALSASIREHLWPGRVIDDRLHRVDRSRGFAPPHLPTLGQVGHRVTAARKDSRSPNSSGPRSGAPHTPRAYAASICAARCCASSAARAWSMSAASFTPIRVRRASSSRSRSSVRSDG